MPEQNDKMTALLGKAALFIPGYEYFSALPQSCLGIYDGIISGYRTNQTALLREPYCNEREENVR